MLSHSIYNARIKAITDFAEYLETDPIFQDKNHHESFSHWHVVVNDFTQQLKDLGLEFNKAIHKGTPLMHMLIACPYLTLEEKRLTIRGLRAFIPGTDTNILDSQGNTTLHYFLKMLLEHPSVQLIDSVIDKSFTQSMYSNCNEINSANPEGSTVLDLLNEIISNIMYNISALSLNKQVQTKFLELLPTFQEIRSDLIQFGAKEA